MQIHQVDFVKGVTSWSDLPEGGLPEVAFVGRSNVGKSSFINMLVGRKNLVRTSKTPGGTRELNFFNLNGRMYLVDMPGLGFARTAPAQREHWARLVERYVTEREALRLVIHLVDSRHAPMAVDEALMAVMATGSPRYVVALTKADKLSRSEQARAGLVVRRTLEGHGLDPAVVVTSATTNLGRSEVWRLITEALAPGD